MNILNMTAEEFFATITMPVRAAALDAEGAARTAAMLEEHKKGVAEMQLRAAQRQAAFDAEVAARRAARDEDTKNRMDAIEREYREAVAKMRGFR